VSIRSEAPQSSQQHDGAGAEAGGQDVHIANRQRIWRREGGAEDLDAIGQLWPWVQGRQLHRVRGFRIPPVHLADLVERSDDCATLRVPYMKVVHVREGMAADFVVFDPETIGAEMPELVADLPAGAKRLVQRCRGVAATVVNGETILRDGKPTGAHPGQLLRGPLARRG